MGNSNSLSKALPDCRQSESPDPQPGVQTSPQSPQAETPNPKPAIENIPPCFQAATPSLQTSPPRPDAKPLPPDTIPFKPRPFEVPKGNFLLSSDKILIFKPITFDANGVNAEDELYKVINGEEFSGAIERYTPKYHGLYHNPPTDTYYIGLENLTHWLEPNASVMIIDMTTSLESFRIIGQQIWDTKSSMYHIFKATYFQGVNNDEAIEDLLQFFQHSLCTTSHFRIQLQQLHDWFTQHNTRFYFPRSSLLFAYNRVATEPDDEHLKQHLDTPLLDFTSCFRTPKALSIIKMLGFFEAQYLPEPNTELVDQYTIHLENLLNAVVAAEKNILKQIQIKVQAEPISVPQVPEAQTSPLPPQARPLPADTIPFGIPFEHHRINFLIDSNKQYIYKPITLDANGKNAEDELYKVITRGSIANKGPFSRLNTPKYHGLYHDPSTDTYYIGLDNLIKTLGPNPSMMFIDMKTSNESFSIIGQQIWNEVIQEYQVFEADDFQSDEEVEDLLKFFQNNLCIAYQFRINLQQLYLWFKEHNTRLYFSSSFLFFAYNKADLPEPDEVHIKEHLATSIRRFDNCYLETYHRLLDVTMMFGCSQSQYLPEPDKALVDKYTLHLKNLLDAVVAAEEKILKEMRVKYQTGPI